MRCLISNVPQVFNCPQGKWITGAFVLCSACPLDSPANKWNGADGLSIGNPGWGEGGANIISTVRLTVTIAQSCNSFETLLFFTLFSVLLSVVVLYFKFHWFYKGFGFPKFYLYPGTLSPCKLCEPGLRESTFTQCSAVGTMHEYDHKSLLPPNKG